MKLYRVDLEGYYGTNGWIVLAESPDRAKELVIENNVLNEERRRSLRATELSADASEEFCSQEMCW